MVTLRHAGDIDATARVIVSDAEQDEQRVESLVQRFKMQQVQNHVMWVLQTDDAKLK